MLRPALNTVISYNTSEKEMLAHTRVLCVSLALHSSGFLSVTSLEVKEQTKQGYIITLHIYNRLIHWETEMNVLISCSQA